MRAKSTKSLRKKLWKLVSEYVRMKDADREGITSCFTCGKVGHWKEMDCSHYIHKDSLDFEVNNLRPCCTYCNRYLHGNLGVYAEKLRKEIGDEEISLMRQRSKQVKKWKIGELEELIETYKQALQSLTQEKG